MRDNRDMLFGMAWMMIFVIFLMLTLLCFDYFTTKYQEPHLVHEPRCDTQYNLYYFVWEKTPVATMNFIQKRKWCDPSPTFTWTYRTPTPTYCYSYIGTGDC